jgi:hypothetical protein
MSLPFTAPLILWLLATAHAAQLDGEGIPMKDALLDHLEGRWNVATTVLGTPGTQTLDATWVLAHQFLQLRIVETTKGTTAPYEAIVYIGRDTMSERYVAHWIDVFGGRTSETLGYGVLDGDAVQFVFEYPDGPFRTRFNWEARTGEWTVDGRTKTAEGVWVDFMSERLTRRP